MAHLPIKKPRLKTLTRWKPLTIIYPLHFAVEILNEGWDVFNLFDIVKLDEALHSKNKTTTKRSTTHRAWS